MFTFLSLVTSVKDYIEIAHKLVETDPTQGIKMYQDFGAIVTYVVLGGKQFLSDFLTFQWFQNLSSIPLLIPDIASAMISEISVFDGYFHNAFTLLETPISYGNQNIVFYSLEKFTLGLLNSLFLCLPTSTSHVITLRRFVMQGLEAGYLAGLGTLCGNILWIGSIIFGLRFLVIPWLSLDILRYLLGFLLIVKYMWDSYNEKRSVLEDVSKWKIFLLNFLLAFTEQSQIYPFINHISFGSDSSILESFPVSNTFEFLTVHFSYLAGIFLGGFSLLQFTCWFWENPAYQIYMWAISSFKVSTSLYSKVLNFGFLYLTMICALSNIAYFGLDYTLANPLGFVHEDRFFEQKSLIETSFLNTKASDRNTRRNRGRHGRRERWKRRVRRYRTFDASLYDQGIYDLFTMEDLNYGFDRFWLRRKIRNHRLRFRFFPGPWMRSFKKQLARPRLESFMGPRIEFFRILFEQAYHPEFHEFHKQKSSDSNNKTNQIQNLTFQKNSKLVSLYLDNQVTQKSKQKGLFKENSALRKFVRKTNKRLKTAQILFESKNSQLLNQNLMNSQKSIFSKRWKKIFSILNNDIQPQNSRKNIFQNFYQRILLNKTKVSFNFKGDLKETNRGEKTFNSSFDSQKKLSHKDKQILKYKSFLMSSSNKKSANSKINSNQMYKPLTLFHPLQFYLQREQAFQKKMKFYGANVFRNFGIENNAPYYRVMMKRFFYYYKPTLRWERTMRTATMRKARRKTSRTPRKLNINNQTKALAQMNIDLSNLRQNSNISISEETLTTTPKMQKPTHFYSLLSKRANRYRYQIYKDVLQHWYYTPFNRLFMKLDVDSFIRRQPSSYFLTKNEEKLLHIRRFLLSEYSNTLRWYTYMQHYNSMKTQIGGTKSFASRTYNQQFQGTFKKIRHLFAMTPSLSDNSILKFDQPLFNEYKNDNTASILNDSIVHEELLADDSMYGNSFFYPEDLTNQSLKILREYLVTATPERKAYIQKLLADQNYWEISQFLFKGQKLRGNKVISNQKSLLNQENSYLLDFEKNKSNKNTDSFWKSLGTFNYERLNAREFQNEIWLSLIKKCQTQLYDQQAIKNYVIGHVEKREKQKQRRQKYLKTRLERMKNWFIFKNSKEKSSQQVSGLSTSLQKAIKEGILFQKGELLNQQKLNIRNNRPQVYQNLFFLPNSKKDKQSVDTKLFLTKRSLLLKAHLQNRSKIKALQVIQSERDLFKKFEKTQAIISEKQEFKLQQTLSKIIKRTLTPFQFVGSKLLTPFVESPIKEIKFFLSKKTDSDLEIWKRREMAFASRKKIRRKISRVLDKQNPAPANQNFGDLSQYKYSKLNSNLTPNRQKRDSNAKFSDLQKSRQINSWTSFDKIREDSNSSIDNFFKHFYDRSFKRKRSRSRRSRSLKGRRLIQKHTLGEKWKRQFSLLRKYSRKSERSNQLTDNNYIQNQKMQIWQMITKRKDPLNNSNIISKDQSKTNFETQEIKQRRTRQSKHRFWKKHKKQKYAQNRMKQRKRRRYTLSQIRSLNKDYKRIQDNYEIKKWWWQTFLPNLQATSDALWQVEKSKQIQQELSNLSISDILNRDEKNVQSLQIGDKDFKPLMMPEALRLRQKLIQDDILNFGEKIEKLLSSSNSDPINLKSLNVNQNKISNSFMEQISKNVLTDKTISKVNKNNSPSLNEVETRSSRFMVSTTSIPFYAGWDESQRKFVITNRLLSRKDAGYLINFDKKDAQYLKNQNVNDPSTKSVIFSKAPLQGMNAATTLYWQVPFTTYDPDQFFALGLDGFSPLGWRYFNFKHSKQTTKPILVRNILSTLQKKNQKNSLLSYHLQLKILDKKQLLRKDKTSSSSLQQDFLSHTSASKNEFRKIQKRNKRVKNHPRIPPVWYPSGPLTNQVLPVHYIYVFYKRSRLPRDRYIRRRLTKFSTDSNPITQLSEFTLRKRVKPKRKYHRKRQFIKTESLVLRKRKFRTFSNEPENARLISKSQYDSQTELNLLKYKTKSKKINRKGTANSQQENLRIRQLRKRVQRQVFRPVWRYKPRSGGLVWPGNYLLLEQVKAPKLKTNLIENSTKTNRQRKIRKKKRRMIQQWQIQPKKYLLQKHNLKVLKKRLEKSQNLNKLDQKVQEFQYLNQKL